MKQPISILMVESLTENRHNLRQALNDAPEFILRGEAADIKTGLELLKQLELDVLLVGQVEGEEIPGEFIRQVKKLAPQMRIILTGVGRMDPVVRAGLEAGADGYVLNGTSSSEMRRVILLALESGPALTAGVFHAEPVVQEGEVQLSEREREVLNCIARGMTTTAIAGELFISENTVKTHIRHILEKLNASSRAEAVHKAMLQGILQGKPTS